MSFSFTEIEESWLERDNLSVLNCNIRSIRKNVDQLVVYLSQHSFVYDIIAVTETWLKDGETVEIPGYECLSLPRNSASRGGGVALFIKCGIEYQCLSESCCSRKTVESLFLYLKLGVTVGVVYRPPNSCYNEFISGMESILDPLMSRTTPLVICGDFNIDLLTASDRDYVFLLQSFSLKNVISAPTRVTSKSATLIDHVLCNIDITVRAGVYEVPIADHYPTFIFLPRTYLYPLCEKLAERATRVDYGNVNSLLKLINFKPCMIPTLT